MSIITRIGREGEGGRGKGERGERGGGTRVHDYVRGNFLKRRKKIFPCFLVRSISLVYETHFEYFAGNDGQ